MYDALLVAGTHIYRADVMMLSKALEQCPIRKIFGGSHEESGGWFGNLDFVRVPPVGKYTMDRTIAMEAVRLHLAQGVKHILLASPRSWMGDAAIQLRQQFPALQISLAVNRATLDAAVQAKLDAAGITSDPILETTRPLVAAQLLGIFRALQLTSPNGQVHSQKFYNTLASADSTLPLNPSLTGLKRFKSTMEFFGLDTRTCDPAIQPSASFSSTEGFSPCP